jgi:hypothetical protein
MAKPFVVGLGTAEAVSLRFVATRRKLPEVNGSFLRWPSLLWWVSARLKPCPYDSLRQKAKGSRSEPKLSEMAKPFVVGGMRRALARAKALFFGSCFFSGLSPLLPPVRFARADLSG